MDELIRRLQERVRYCPAVELDASTQAKISGPVTLGGSLLATDDLRLAGGATVNTPNAVTLSARGRASLVR